MKAVIYARYSAGPNQTDQSIEGQIRDCRAYAFNHGIDIIGEYIDRAISGTDFQRRIEFNRLISDSAKKKFDAVIVWKIDRFGRNKEEIAINKVKLRKNNVKLLYAMEHIPDGPEGIILESVLEGMAEYYSAELSQKVKRGLRESALKGHALGANKMTGYVVEDKKYVVDPSTAAIVREIFERYASGASAGTIAKSLNERGLVNARGNQWRDHLIYSMLRNEKYIGIYKYADIVLTDVIPPIIDQGLWDRVQTKLAMNATNKNRSRTSSSEDFILTGKLHCGFCGAGFCGESGTSRSGAMYYYYKCSTRKHNRKNPADCNQRTFRKDDLEEWICEMTVKNVMTPDMIDYLVNKVLELQSANDATIYVKALKKQLSDANKAIKNIMKAIEAGIFTDTTRDRLVELEQTKSDLTAAISQAELNQNEFTDEQIAMWLCSAIDGDLSDVAFRERIVASFISNITVYEDRVLVVYNFMDGQERAAYEFELEEIKKTADCVRLSEFEQSQSVSSRTIIYISLYHFAVVLPLAS